MIDKLLRVVLVFLAASFFLDKGVSSAQKKFRPEMVLPSHFPEFFDGLGKIERMEGDEIVINEKLLKISARLTVATKRSQHASRDLLKVGDTVGFTTNSVGEITGIWLIESGAGR